MPERPILPLPTPSAVSVPRGGGGGSSLRLPSAVTQQQKFGPLFNRLRDVLGRADGAVQLRDDPSNLAPDRVIVFEIAGTIDNFLKAVSRIQGLEFMAEYESDFAADEYFAVQDDRVGKEGQDRTDKQVPGRFYLAMPDVRALQEVLSLWERWQNGQAFDSGFAPFTHLFKQLHALRPWGPQDRIPEETMAFWREESLRNPGQPIRTEVELWYRDNETRRRNAAQTLRDMVAEAGGQIVHESVIGEIAYHGMLIDIPAGDVQNLMSERTVKLALADDVMFLRPQSLLRGPLEIEAEADGSLTERPAPIPAGRPVAALLDGVPVQAHALLADRLMLDDPDNLQSRALVSRRVHGTAMASLILHGDRNENGASLPRPLYVRPLMLANENGIEHTDADRLLIDTIYRAIVRMKGGPGEEATAPTVFLVNLSMGDTRRPFTRLISPLARLLDFLSDRYNILFLVSGGNVSDTLNIADFTSWTDFESATPKDREKAVLRALNAAKHERTILSPAESLNALTIGAQHHDNVAQRQGLHNSVDPFEDNTLPNVSSGLGLGHRRMIKPDLYFPGGREHVRMQGTGGGGVRISVGSPRKLYGLSAAAPDALGQGRLDQVALSDGTSSATALATRAGHQIFDSLMDRDGGSLLADIDPKFYAVVVKALLVHSAQWNGNDELLKEICGPEDKRRHAERAENSCRFIGFGVPDIREALECSPSRATLVGFGALRPETAHNFRIPLPGCLERVTDPRSLSVTVAWFSPIKPGHQSYRSVRLEAAPLHPVLQVLGVKRRKSQPADPTVKRGSVFHEHFEGQSAVPYIDDGHLSMRVWCKEDAGLAGNEAVRYGIAVTIEAGSALPVYEQIQQRLVIRPRP